MLVRSVEEKQKENGTHSHIHTHAACCMHTMHTLRSVFMMNDSKTKNWYKTTGTGTTNRCSIDSQKDTMDARMHVHCTCRSRRTAHTHTQRAPRQARFVVSLLFFSFVLGCARKISCHRYVFITMTWILPLFSIYSDGIVYADVFLFNDGNETHLSISTAVKPYKCVPNRIDKHPNDPTNETPNR